MLRSMGMHPSKAQCKLALPLCTYHAMACRMKALLTENGPTRQGTRDPSQTFLGRATLADLFYLLRLEVHPSFYMLLV